MTLQIPNEQLDPTYHDEEIVVLQICKQQAGETSAPSDAYIFGDEDDQESSDIDEFM